MADLVTLPAKITTAEQQKQLTHVCGLVKQVPNGLSLLLRVPEDEWFTSSLFAGTPVKYVNPERLKEMALDTLTVIDGTVQLDGATLELFDLAEVEDILQRLAGQCGVLNREEDDNGNAEWFLNRAGCHVVARLRPY